MKFFKLLSFLAVFGCSLIASAQEKDSLAISSEASNHKAIQNDYLTIVYGPYSLKYYMAYVSLNGEDYQKIKQKRSKLFNHYDFNGLIKLIKKYNAEGWELIGEEFNFKEEGGDYLFLMMMRDGKEQNIEEN
ncbi:hypothetical protein [Zunongwangia sp. HGR-M22]|uniref:hypothetical protein n=1 Tax=Zunongwangia sp. HGR-M22 TaxID=3015168 RepID=UPI0022DE6A0D|nr:hypothetical protein [Zunongwangia sp. HGR-M22]WBL25895.1 hypothetical protein PBT91_01055 [Zunongwangia sp. HGR-M22]